MLRKDVIQVEGTVEEALNGAVYHVRLANGHRLLAHVAARKRVEFGRIDTGDKVTMELSPYDLSKGGIILIEKTNNNYESPSVS